MLCSAAAEPQQQYAFSERGAGQHGLRGAFYGCRSSCQTIPGSGRPGKPVLMESATPAASAAMAIRDTMAVYEPKATMRSKGYTQTKKLHDMKPNALTPNGGLRAAQKALISWGVGRVGGRLLLTPCVF